MFLPCPHCGYLVALILPSAAGAQDHSAPHCPRCDGALPAESAAPDLHEGTGDAATPALSGDSAGSTGVDAVRNVSAGVVAGAVRHPGPASAMVDVVDAPSATSPSPAAGTQPGSQTPAALPLPGAARTRRAPSFVRGAAPATAARRRWPWVAATAGLGLLLALQLLLAQRHELAASARWRPLVAGLCSVLPCAIPPWREPRAFTMLSRNVQPSRAAAGVLVVDADFRNDARWPQPWPDLVLSLSDVEGQTLATRAFTPAQYRQRTTGATDRLAPGQIATARLQVREPAPGVVAFTFDFQ